MSFLPMNYMFHFFGLYTGYIIYLFLIHLHQTSLLCLVRIIQRFLRHTTLPTFFVHAIQHTLAVSVFKFSCFFVFKLLPQLYYRSPASFCGLLLVSICPSFLSVPSLELCNHHMSIDSYKHRSIKIYCACDVKTNYSKNRVHKIFNVSFGMNATIQFQCTWQNAARQSKNFLVEVVQFVAVHTLVTVPAGSIVGDLKRSRSSVRSAKSLLSCSLLPAILGLWSVGQRNIIGPSRNKDSSFLRNRNVLQDSSWTTHISYCRPIQKPIFVFSAISQRCTMSLCMHPSRFSLLPAIYNYWPLWQIMWDSYLLPACHFAL